MTTSWAKGSFPILPLLYRVFLFLFFYFLITGCLGQHARTSTNSGNLEITTKHNPQWPEEIAGLYHVFLSFRGADTRKGFTSHLFAALVQNGFLTFMDDTGLKKGEYISSQLMRAIEGSKISLIVFSKNYAESMWCLDELVKIMDCRKAFKQMVIPIFYDVAPSDVRMQTGVVEEAFSKHEERFREGSDGKVEKWRAALTEAANLPGWVLRNVANGNEAELIKIIIAEVAKIVNPTHLNLVDHQVGPDQLLPSQIWQSQNCWPPIPPAPSYLFPQIQKGLQEVLELAGNNSEWWRFWICFSRLCEFCVFV